MCRKNVKSRLKKDNGTVRKVKKLSTKHTTHSKKSYSIVTEEQRPTRRYIIEWSGEATESGPLSVYLINEETGEIIRTASENGGSHTARSYLNNSEARGQNMETKNVHEAESPLKSSSSSTNASSPAKRTSDQAFPDEVQWEAKKAHETTKPELGFDSVRTDTEAEKSCAHIRKLINETMKMFSSTDDVEALDNSSTNNGTSSNPVKGNRKRYEISSSTNQKRTKSVKNLENNYSIASGHGSEREPSVLSLMEDVLSGRIENLLETSSERSTVVRKKRTAKKSNNRDELDAGCAMTEENLLTNMSKTEQILRMCDLQLLINAEAKQSTSESSRALSVIQHTANIRGQANRQILGRQKYLEDRIQNVPMNFSPQVFAYAEKVFHSLQAVIYKFVNILIMLDATGTPRARKMQEVAAGIDVSMIPYIDVAHLILTAEVRARTLFELIGEGVLGLSPDRLDHLDELTEAETNTLHQFNLKIREVCGLPVVKYRDYICFYYAKMYLDHVMPVPQKL